MSAPYLQPGAGGLPSCSCLRDPTQGTESQPAGAFASPARGLAGGARALPCQVRSLPLLCQRPGLPQAFLPPSPPAAGA